MYIGTTLLSVIIDQTAITSLGLAELYCNNGLATADGMAPDRGPDEHGSIGKGVLGA